MILTTFKRYEVKYLLTTEQYHLIQEAFREHVVFDDYCKNKGSYMIYNLYFDTENDDVIRRSLEKPYFKEKLRLRSYVLPRGEEDLVFLELKKKIGGVVAKRRVRLPLAEAIRFVENRSFPERNQIKDDQVLGEISDFLRRYPVKAKVLISYERTAYFAKDNPELRVSFDQKILTRRGAVDFSSGGSNTELLPDGHILMEIKCDGSIPLWLCQILSEMKLYKTSFSKYGTEYKHFLKNKAKVRIEKSA
jgi:hypothetical protein